MLVFTAKQVKVLSAIVAILGILTTLTPSKTDNQVIQVLRKLLVHVNATV